MYLEMATEEDKKMADNWKADADGILIFVGFNLLILCFSPAHPSKTGLFSAAVASLISVSIQDIRPNPQDTSNFYLANIHQSLADPNRSTTSRSLPSPPTFSPPNYAVWVNALWFLSLVISITCALLATLLQQWARRYLKVTQPRYSPNKRARIRAFFAEGVEKFFLHWTVELLPTLLHVSLFLFFAGLAVFLWNINLTIFKLVLSWICACTALYGCITFMPIFHHDSPYYTPLSILVWQLVTGITYVIYQVRRLFGPSRLPRLVALWRSRDRYHKMFFQGMHKTAEGTALNSSSAIDTRAFLWTFDSLDEDHELERFFSGLPGFRSSKVIDDPLPRLTEEGKERLFTALIGLLDRTFSSDLLPKPVKNRLAIICAKAIHPTDIPYQLILTSTFSRDQYVGLRTAEFGHIVRGWADSLSDNQDAALIIRAILTGIVAKATRRDDSWHILASKELGVPEFHLRGYTTLGDSLSLAILIHVIRQQFDHFGKPSWPEFEISKVLETASKFNVQDTSGELQHDFCALWNQIVLKAQNEDDQNIAWDILRPIRKIYVALHRDTDSTPARFSASRSIMLRMPSSYPVCNVAGHIHRGLHDPAQ